MAELHVQPKRNNFWWLWLLLAIIIIACLIYYFNYYQKGETMEMTSPTDSSYTLNNSSDTSVVGIESTANLWDKVDFNSPDTTYPEVTDKNVIIKSNAHFVIYSLSIQDLFADGKSDLSNEGKESLKQIVSSINQRFKSGKIRIYAQPDTSNTDQLALQRGESISNYFAQNSNLDQSRLSVYHIEEGTSLPDKKNTVNIVVKR